ncbi:hypothetical protein J1G42_04965 [Cellulomonas sp. zg-ZUI222]|uniref:hypothetical protein n=1 Tax=Cellulomonas wangleii TaxID=2816956 RepID=UPI001A93D8F5|nr:hypothetical protein [Cellulomonas wangleii]MBO0920177.1 hypothetical protein [Cellulomonas wangleii]
MRSRRRLALPVLLLLTVAACSEGTTPEPEPSASASDGQIAAPTVPGRGQTELPTVEEQQEALASAGESTEAFAAPLDAGESEVGQVADVPAGPYLLRVVCTSSDGGPVTVTVAAAADGTELTSYQAPCAPVFQGGSTMADSDPFEVPAGAVDVGVTAAADSVVAVGLVAAG